MQRVGAAERERGDRQRRHRVEARGGEPRAAERLHPEPADDEADREPDPELAHEQQQHVREAVVGLLDVLDQREDQQHGDRVVEARLALERTRQPPPQGRVAQQREDRRAVGAREHRADEQALLEVEAEQQRRRHAGDRRRDRGGDERQRDRGPEHRADLHEAGGQAALEQDQRQGDDPDRAGQLVVAEVDPARCRPSRSPSRGRGTAAGRAPAACRRRATPAGPPRAARPRRGSADHRGLSARAQILWRWRSFLPMTMRWISEVPSPISSSGASR